MVSTAVLVVWSLLAGPDGELPDRLRNLEPRLLEHVSNEIMDQDPNVRWDDIGKLSFQQILEMRSVGSDDGLDD